MSNNSLLKVLSAGVRTKAAVDAMTYANTGGAFSGGGWFGVIRESFAGAFQSVVQVDSPRNIVAFSGVFSCVTLIASDVAKLGIKLVVEAGDICVAAAPNSPFWRVLRKPNHFQNWVQFAEQWILSKLLWGNTFVLKVRADGRGVVTALYVLDAQRVKPLVTTEGDVYYELKADHLSGLTSTITVPASEIIHDRMNCLWHPLIGVSPLYSAAMSATMGNRIQANSASFFTNMSRPSGMLTAPGTIDEPTATRLKQEFEQGYSGHNIGRLFVGGDGLQYNAMTMPAEQAQLIEQLRWTVEDVARCFHMPLFKIGAETGRASGNLSVEALQQQYLNDCLQILIESMETCLDDGLGLPSGYHAEIDEDDLLRMDKVAQAEVNTKLSGAGIIKIDEARANFNLPPVTGGNTPYLQQQNYSLAALAKRDASADPFATAKPALPPPTPTPAPTKDYTAEALADVAELAKTLPALQITKPEVAYA